MVVMRTRALPKPLAALTLTLCVACGALEKVPDNEVDAAQKAAAQRIATKIYEGCKTGQHEALGDDAIPEMQVALAPDRQKATCQSVSGTFGEYVSMDYAETWKQKSLRLYRFKGHFSKGAPPEIRVVMDGPKLSGFWLKPWTDTPQ